MISLNPYLVFKGNCEEAFTYYKEVFNAETLYLGRYKDVPDESKKFFLNAENEKIMHVTLKINAQTVIMGLDDINANTQSPIEKSFYLYVHAEVLIEAVRIFNQLALGGEVIMPIDQTFWTNAYGIVIDRFGIGWKITSD